MPKGPRFEDIAPGLDVPPLVRPIGMLEIVRFAAYSETLGLLHIDKDFARQKLGYPDVNVQGSLKMAMLCTMLTGWAADTGALARFSCRYRGMDYCGDTLSARAKVVKTYKQDGAGHVECDVWVENQRGERATTGSATLTFPPVRTNAAPARSEGGGTGPTESGARGSLLTPEVRAMVGRESAPTTEQVERGAVRRWTKATFDASPLHTDESYARASAYKCLVAPPSYLHAIAKDFMDEAQDLHIPVTAKQRVAGGEDWEFFLPILVGDIITRRQKIADIYEKQTKARTMLFIVTEISYSNQRGELAALARNTSIAY